MKRFFIDAEAIKGDIVQLGKTETHHLRDVVRLKVGDKIIGVDGKSKRYNLRIKRLSSDAVEAEIERISSVDMDMPRVLLGCALPKKSRMDYIVEKATELGVSEIIPLITERTVVKINDKNKATKHKRWEKIAIEASKQCGRVRFPKIYQVMEFKDAIGVTADLGYRKKILPCLCEEKNYIDELLPANIKKAAVFIGPEGDFSLQEITYATKCGFELASLGPFILKVDTACLFTISIIQERLFRL